MLNSAASGSHDVGEPESRASSGAWRRDAHDVQVVIARLDVDDEAQRAGLAVLADDERARASRFQFERDRRRYVVGRALLRRFLAARLDTAPASIGIVYGSHGKPALAARHAHAALRFNVAHCDDLVAFAFAAEREVGVDVEALRSIPDADALAQRWFARGEVEAYRSLPEVDRPLGFLNCWTRKEAFVKALGDGLTHPLDTFEVTLAPRQPARLVRVGETPGDRSGWKLYAVDGDAGAIAAVVVQELPGDSDAAGVVPAVESLSVAASAVWCHG